MAAKAPSPKGQDAPSPSQLIELKERTFHGDPKKAALRNEVFDYLGIKPNEAAFYVFVSTSMPKALLQAYVAEAQWAGAVLVVRGVPDGMTLAQWIKQYGEPVVGEKGVTSGLTIDPILFDLYNVKSIPSIVWDQTDRLFGEDCDTAELMKPGEKGKLTKVKSCRPYPDDSYYAVSGAVTLDYALTAFGEAGAAGATKRLELLRQFVAGGKKEQEEFKGDWSSYETAEMRAAVERANKSGERYESIMQSFQQPYFESDLERRNRLGAAGFAPGLEPGTDGTANR
jgi:type-F conjugative transfer system pilin assembly protein TrbC